MTSRLSSGAFPAICSASSRARAASGLSDLVSEAEPPALFGVESATGEHHLAHAIGTDHSPDADRGATADIDTQPALGQSEERGWVGDTGTWAVSASSRPPPMTAPRRAATTGTVPC